MSKGKLRIVDYMRHIREAIERIDSYTNDCDEVRFSESNLISDAVIRNFEVIGEACHNIKRDFPEFAKSNPSVPLRFAYEMRNAIGHGYYKVDLDQVWNSIHADLPGLHKQIAGLIHENNVTILAEAELIAIQQAPNDIRKQNELKHEIAELMGLTNQEISELVNSPKSL